MERYGEEKILVSWEEMERKAQEFDMDVYTYVYTLRKRGIEVESNRYTISASTEFYIKETDLVRK